MDLTTMTERALVRAWQLSGSFVQSCTCVVPAGFIAVTGSNGPDTVPVPYYALAYIMKL
jgi:hypothetical protein